MSLPTYFWLQGGLWSLAHCLCQVWGGGRQCTEGMVYHQGLAQGAPPRFTWHAAVSTTFLSAHMLPEYLAYEMLLPTNTGSCACCRPAVFSEACLQCLIF